MADILGIGISALQTAQTGLLTTQNNIANANTPGYHRQMITQTQLLSQLTGAGYVGSGVQANGIQRIYSQFLDKQLLSVGTQNSYLQTYSQQVGQIDNFLADPNADLSPALQSFFSAVQDVAANPSSVPSRQALLSNANALIGRFTSMQSRFNDIRNGINQQLQSTVSSINSYSKQIAALNDQIALATGVADNGQAPNDLLDQRDQLISQLNQLVKVSTVSGSNGELNVFIGQGQPLVVGNRATELATMQSPEDPDNLVVGYKTSSTATPREIASNLLNGGSLGGLLDFRSQSLDPAQNALGRVAAGLVQTFNAQHALGVDLNGTIGNNFFNAFSGTTAPVVQANALNTSTASISAVYANTANLTSSNYRISFDGTNYSLTDLSTNQVTTGIPPANLSTAVPGLTLTVSGSPAAGDSFLVLPTRYASRDIGVSISNVTEIAAALPVTTGTGTANTGTGVISAGDVTSTSTLPTAAVTMTYNSATQKFDLTSTDPAWNGVSVPTTGTYTSGSTISINGVSFSVTGAPANGDIFTLNPNYGSSFTGDADNRNAMKLGALVSTPTMINNASGAPTASYQDAYSQLVSFIGNQANEMNVKSSAQQTLLDQATQTQQSFSGVNLDEEAANLMRYQYAYQAAAKSIQTAQTVFQTLLSLGG